MVELLELRRREIAGGAVQSPAVPPVDPLGRHQLDLLRAAPGAAPAVPTQTLTEPWRNEDRDFVGSLDAIRQAAELSLPELRRQIDDVHAFLIERFIPHARAEEDVVYPLVERVLGAPHATEPTVRDHAEVSRLAGKLLALRERLVYSYFGAAQLRSLREVEGRHNSIRVQAARA